MLAVRNENTGQRGAPAASLPLHNPVQPGGQGKARPATGTRGALCALPKRRRRLGSVRGERAGESVCVRARASERACQVEPTHLQGGGGRCLPAVRALAGFVDDGPPLAAPTRNLMHDDPRAQPARHVRPTLLPADAPLERHRTLPHLLTGTRRRIWVFLAARRQETKQRW